MHQLFQVIYFQMKHIFFQCNSTQTVEMSVDVYVAVHVLLQAILPYFVPFLIMLMPLSSLINLHNKARLLHLGLILSNFEEYFYARPSVCISAELPPTLPDNWIFRLLISMYRISWENKHVSISNMSQLIINQIKTVPLNFVVNTAVIQYCVYYEI